MVTFSKSDFIAHEAKRIIKPSRGLAEKAVELETPLHTKIMKWCDAQWPVWTYIHARTDKKSTIEKGAQDFTIFTPGGGVLCVECKARNEKQDPDQLAWAAKMRMLGHEVHVVRSMEEFKTLAVLHAERHDRLN